MTQPQQTDTLHIYTIDELTKMSKAELFAIDMRQLQICEELTKYYQKLYDKKNLTQTLHFWVFGNTRYESLMHRGVIKNFLAQFGIVPHNVFTTDVLVGKTKDEIREISLDQLCFPHRKELELMVEKYYEVKDKRVDVLSVIRLEEILQLDILPVGAYTWERVRGMGEKTLFDIRNHILKLGFEKGEYPFLAAKYWEEREAKQADYMLSLREELKVIFNCSESEIEKIIHIAKEYEWLPTYHNP